MPTFFPPTRRPCHLGDVTRDPSGSHSCRRQRVGSPCLTSPRHSPRPEDLTAPRKRGGERDLLKHSHPPGAGSPNCCSSSTARLRADASAPLRGRETPASSNDSSCHQRLRATIKRPRPLRTCRRLSSTPALSADAQTRRQRFKNHRFINHLHGQVQESPRTSPRTKQILKTRQLGSLS
ncbi:hypothetical protein T484DRAFT_3043514 [Baffinella frigidus]|nr:hypothetical protein T484DRAFT_3043514 [Cryptophyta sp. CCMP2293]